MKKRWRVRGVYCDGTDAWLAPKDFRTRAGAERYRYGLHCILLRLLGGGAIVERIPNA